jgi:uncharacterized protein (DUF1501 family)
MPNNTRQAIKQDLQTVLNQLDKAQIKLVALGSQFHDTHKDEFDFLSNIVTVLETCRSAVATFQDRI